MSTIITGEYLLPGEFPRKTEEEHFERYKFAAQYVKRKNILDIACGVGYGCKIYSESGANTIVGIDVLPDNIAHAKSNYSADNISFIQNNLYDINYTEEFDIISSFETIEHVDNDSLALAKMHRALKADGLLIISTPNRKITSPNSKSINDKPLNEYHVREYTLAEFKHLLTSNGFRILKVLGQRNRIFFPFYICNRIVNKFYKPDTNGNSKPKKNILTQARYYTLVLEKIV